MADVSEQMIWQGDVWNGMFVHSEYCRNTSGRSPFESGPVQVDNLMKLWIVACGEQQNPLLDQNVLEKFGVKADDALLTNEMKTIDMEGPEYITGGGTQNSIRVAQWMLQKKAASSIGCVGKDEYAHKMQATCEKGNVACVYMVGENTYTTTCACCIVGTERSLIAVSPVSITLASSHCNKKDETYCTNLSAPYIVEVPPFKEVLMENDPQH